MKHAFAVVALLILGGGIAAAQDVPPLPPGATPEAAPAVAGQQTPQPPQGPQPRQPDLGRWWKNSDIVRELQLTDAQVNQIEQAFFDHRLKLIDLKAGVEREETKLQPLIEADQLDLPKVSAQLDAVLAARSQLQKQETMMMLSIRKVLTVEQWKRLQRIQMERERRWGGYAPGPALAPGAPRVRTPGPDREPGPPRPPED